jgi:hypothetical protein
MISSLSHWLETPDIRSIEHDCLCHDQRIFRIDGCLDIVAPKRRLSQ